MFETLTDKLTATFKQLTNRGRLTEKDVDDALRQVRLALLEADVNFKVARDFVAKVRDRSIGQEVLEALSPGQQVIKVVHEELTSILSGGDHKLIRSSRPPTVVTLAGLQGSGKTTSAAKLAVQLRRQGQESLLVAADLRRPAAVEQLVALGRQIEVPVYYEDSPSTVVAVAQAGLSRANEIGVSYVIIDTSGRLAIDEEMMRELAAVHRKVSSDEVLLVLDAMTGQDAVQTAEEFHHQVPLSGLIMTKLDGDARGGAALSVTRVTGVPIKFIGTGEKPDALEPFYPERLASRILGMGDVLTLIEKAQEVVDHNQAKELEKKIRKASFGLEDFLEQIQSVRRMGSIGQFVEMIPGFSQISKRMPEGALDEQQLQKIEAIIRSMTPQERRNPDLIRGSRRRRIALGSGTKPQDINQLLNQFSQAQKLMRQLSHQRGPKNLTGFFQ